MKTAVNETDFQDLDLIKRGKVRDIYDLGETLLMVASDRISAFDVVMPDPVADKGIILTQISLYWFEIMKPIIENHVISAEINDYPAVCRPYAETLRGRSMLVKKKQNRCQLNVSCEAISPVLDGNPIRKQAVFAESSCRGPYGNRTNYLNRFLRHQPRKSLGLMISILILQKQKRESDRRLLPR